MSDNELLIKINADATQISEAFDSIRDKTSALEDSLSGLAKISGAAFAVLTAQVGVSLLAFKEQQDATIKLSAALQAQGIYTDELAATYKSYAEEVESTTGIDKAQIIQAQAVAQSFLGQTKITKELTAAIADLSIRQGIGLTEAASELGKAIGLGTGRLAAQQIQFAATDTEAERYQKTLEFVSRTSGGFADAANTGLGSLKGLETAFKENQAALGERFAPAVTAAIKALTEFLTPAKDSTGAMVDFKAALIAVGLVLTGVGVAVPVLGNAFLLAKAGVAALNLELTLTKALLASIGIGLVTIAITELALHWTEASAVIVNVTKGLIEFVSGAFKGIGTVLSGAFHLDSAKIKQGLDEIQEAFRKGAETATQELPKATEKAEAKQLEVSKQYADKAAAFRKEQDDIKITLAKEQQDLELLELKNASDAQIKLKKEEIKTLEELEKSRNTELRTLLKERYAQLRAEEIEQVEEDKKKQEEFDQEDLAARRKHGNAVVQIRTQEEKKEIADIKKNTDTEKTAQKKVYEEDLKERQKQHNTYLQEQIKYGTAYATINQAIHATEVQGFASATQDLAQLTQSKNAKLKEIGKVAALANIVIQTAQSAMNIYAGFSQIPIIGPILGIAGAAAAIAFGAEKFQTVQAAATGGIVAGSGSGDTVPFLLEPGELITPKKNFDEVVNATADARNGQGNLGGAGGEDVLGVLKSIDGKVGSLNQTVINGDVVADKTFIDALVRQINKAVEFRNARLITKPVGTS